MRSFLTQLAEHQPFSQAEAEAAMRCILQGDATELELAAFLVGLRSRGETLDELVGFTKVMRDYAVPVRCEDPYAIDVCGTGGDRSGTFNISTTVALVCAGAGVTVAKHGNRSVSSKSGSADVLAALGVNTDLGKEGVERCLTEAGVAFIFAPLFHPALKHVMPVRRALGVRTMFNILGPLCNPAQVERQLVGAFNREVAEMMARILHRLGAKKAITVYAHDGLDEISTATATDVFWVDQSDMIHAKVVTPEDFHLPRIDPIALRGGEAPENAAILKDLLSGNLQGEKRDIILLNAAHALFVSGKFADLTVSWEAAKESMESGAALRSLEKLIAVSNKA